MNVRMCVTMTIMHCSIFDGWGSYPDMLQNCPVFQVRGIDWLLAASASVYSLIARDNCAVRDDLQRLIHGGSEARQLCYQ
jgi:hypothetical protein